MDVAFGYDSWQTPKGTKFFTLTSGGVREEGALWPAIYTSADKAWGEFFILLMVCIDKNKDKSMHVRQAPHLVELKDWPGYCVVTSRLCFE